MPTDSTTSRRPKATGVRSLIGLCIGHLLVDGYASFPAPLLTSLAPALGVSYSAVSMLVGINSLSSAIGNIVFGLWTDRFRRSGRITVVVSATVTVLCMSAIGVISHYWLLAGVMAVGVFCCGAFHPPAFAIAGQASARKRHQGVSVVMAAGIAACGLGPVFVSQMVHRHGLGGTVRCAILGLLLVPISAVCLFAKGNRRQADEVAVGEADPDDAPGAAGGNRSLVLLFANAAARAYAHMGVVVVVSYLTEHEWGMSVAWSGWGIGSMQVGASLGILVGAYLTQTGEERRTIIWLMPVALLLLVPMSFTIGAVWYLWLLLYGIAVNGPSSVAIGLAQRITPKRRALASGILVGPPFALGAALASLTTPPVLKLYGQASTVAILALPLALAWATALLLPKLQPVR